jgi:hypothetical protein
MARENTSPSTKEATIQIESSTEADAKSVQPEVDNAEIIIYPLRSYLDGQEIRRAGGEGYKSPKHDAVSLIAAGLATDTNPKS